MIPAVHATGAVLFPIKNIKLSPGETAQMVPRLKTLDVLAE